MPGRIKPRMQTATTARLWTEPIRSAISEWEVSQILKEERIRQINLIEQLERERPPQ